MIGFKQIELSDRDILNKFFIERQHQNSECTFTNLYMWRRCFAVRWAMVEGHLIIEPNAFESSWILPPYGYTEDDDSFKEALITLSESYKKKDKPFVIRGVIEEEKERIERLCPSQFNFTEERDIEDYIYRGDDLRLLSGRKYSKKRNHLNAFKREYPEYVFEEIKKENVDEILEFLEHWYGEYNKTGTLNDGLLCEREAVYDALIHMDQLDYSGGLIRIHGKVVAMTFGELVKDDTVVIHIEKAYPWIKGLYAAINQDYLNHFWPHIEYVNREEDMGLDGLRKAKNSYHPVYLLKKYKAEMIQHE